MQGPLSHCFRSSVKVGYSARSPQNLKQNVESNNIEVDSKNICRHKILITKFSHSPIYVEGRIYIKCESTRTAFILLGLVVKVSD